MKLKFKNQQFQSLAVDSVIDCFKGQPNGTGLRYRIDPGTEAQTRTKMTAIGFKNEGLLIPESVLLENIQVLSLFFIDEVAKYRVYTENGEEGGEYAKVFEEEYVDALNDLGLIDLPEYKQYLDGIAVGRTHNGYFSIDKKTKHP